MPARGMNLLSALERQLGKTLDAERAAEERATAQAQKDQAAKAITAEEARAASAAHEARVAKLPAGDLKFLEFLGDRSLEDMSVTELERLAEIAERFSQIQE